MADAQPVPPGMPLGHVRLLDAAPPLCADPNCPACTAIRTLTGMGGPPTPPTQPTPPPAGEPDPDPNAAAATAAKARDQEAAAHVVYLSNLRHQAACNDLDHQQLDEMISRGLVEYERQHWAVMLHLGDTGIIPGATP